MHTNQNKINAASLPLFDMLQEREKLRYDSSLFEKYQCCRKYVIFKLNLSDSEFQNIFRESCEIGYLKNLSMKLSDKGYYF